jgi:glycosyltransferase involved in cell wall biosynthesis
LTDCRVLALLPFLVKGAQSLEIFRAMTVKGIDVSVAFFDDVSSIHAADGMDDFADDGRLIDLSRADHRESFEIICRSIQDRHIDLVLQVGATAAYGNLPRWKEAHPTVRIADLLYNEYTHTLNHFLYERCIDAVIVESDAMRRYVETASSREDLMIEQVRAGVDLDWFTPRESERLGSALVVGYIGRMSPEKNPMGFVEMAERLLPLDPDLQFRMAGSGPVAAEVERRLAESPFRDRIHYLGFLDGSRSLLHEIDVLVLPSKFDGRPAIVMQAGACGIPVIAAPVGAVPEIIEEGVNGYLLYPEQTDAINERLAAWKRSPATLVELRRSARSHACEFFDGDRMVEDYAAAFRRIARAQVSSF